MVGTVKWKIRDDNGKVHNFILPNTYYSSSVETRLLSPQHWAQTRKKGRDSYCVTYHDAIIMRWNKDKYQITAPLDNRKHRNVGVMSTPPGMLSYLHICQKATCPLISFPTTIHQELPTVTDSEEEPTSDRADTPSPMHPLLDQPLWPA